MNLVPFGNTCDLQNGRAFKPEEWSESGTPIIRIQNLNDESKPFNYCNLEVENRFHIDTGDLLFSWSGTPGTSFGAFFWNRGKGFLNQHIFRVDVDDKKVSKTYLRYAINSKLNLIIDQAHGGVGLKHITKSKLEAIEIPLPPLTEQKRIAAILDKADAIRRKRQQAIQLADEFLRAVFLDMFGDPVTNPKGWKIAKFLDVGTLDRGKSKHRPRNDPALLGGEYPLIQTGDVANSKGYIKHYKSTYSDLGLQQSRMWPTGTLCITIAANIAKTGILTFEACFPDSVVGFTPNDNVTVEYIQHWLGFLQKTLESSAPESAQKNINLAILRDLDIPLPDKELQQAFSSIVRRSLKIADVSSRLVLENDNLFSAISQKSLSGALWSW